jgi:hypothetical protein
LGRTAAGNPGLTRGLANIPSFAPRLAHVYYAAMRIKSDIFVSALVRRVFSAGEYAAVLRKGAAEAGAIFVLQRRRDGRATLYAPAPQSFFDDGEQDGRLFEQRLDSNDPGEIDALIEREVRFDPDCWVVELEVEEIGTLVPLSDEAS